MENSTVSATSVAVMSNDMQSYLAELDKKATARPVSGAYFPELRVISSDKLSDDLVRAKGTFVLISKDSEGNKNMTPFEGIPHGIILRVANQYSMYDEVEQKTVYITNEFERGDRIVLKNSEGVIMYDGDQSGLKTWALQHLPDPKSKPENPKHLLKFKFVYYIILTDKWDPQNPVASVYRMYATVGSMDNIKAYDSALKGAPIRYITEISTEKKDNGGVRFYPIKLRVVGESSMEDLMQYINVKKELDEAIRSVTEEYINKTKTVEAEVEEVKAIEPQIIAKVDTSGTGVSDEELADIFG